MTDEARLFAIRERLAPVSTAYLACVRVGDPVSGAAMEFIRHAPADVAWLLARLDSTTECGCPIARVRMHTDECRGRGNT